MEATMTWERLGERRVSRRWVLKATGASAGAAGLAALGCDGGNNNSPFGATPSTVQEDDTQTPRTTATLAPQDGRRGGSLRYTGFVVGDGAYDPHKTQAPPMVGQHALIYSRLLAYQDQAEGQIAADLAASMPERPDAQTLTFRINPNARWHEIAPLNGRPVTAQDVQYSIERQVNGDTSFVRKAQWSVIDSISVPDDRTITIKLKTPMAAMDHLFADVHSFIVAPETAGDANNIGTNGLIGSGPFQWVEWNEGRGASVRRNPNWHGGDRRPNLDGISLTQPAAVDQIEAEMRSRKLDGAMVTRQLADTLRKSIPALAESTMGHSQFFGMRFSLVNDPYNDLRFRTAVTIALERRAMIDQFFGGSGGLSPWVSWPVTRWALPETELTTLPGYKPGAGGRADDLREATAMLAAFRSEKSVKDDLPLMVLDETEAAIGLGQAIQQQLATTLGLTQVRVVPLPLATLVDLLLKGEAPWAAGPDNGWIDLDDWVYPYFHSNGTKNSFPLRDAELDALIDAQRVEFNEEARRETGYQIQRKLLALNAGVNLVSERVVALTWPYVKGFPLDTTDGYQHRFADCWIDQSDASYRAR